MKIGTIGSGFIVHAFINGAINNGNTIEAIYSRTFEKGSALAGQYGVKKIYVDIQKMLNDPVIEFVYIASPNGLHYQQAKQALLAGKNVICEKAFTSTVSELEELIDIARKKHLFLFEAITNIHLPNFKTLQANLDQIGKIKLVQCNYSQYSSRYPALLNGENPNIFNPDFSGGALYDINIYNIHFVTRLFGKPNKVQYYPNMYENGIDTSGILVMVYDDFVCECVGAKDTNSTSFAIIQGEEGYFYIDGANGCRHVKCYIHDEEKVYNDQKDPNNLYYENTDFKEIFEAQDYDACYELLDHSLDVMHILCDARASANIVFKADKEKL